MDRGSAVEPWLLEALVEDTDRLDECLASGMLTVVPGGVAFRHEFAPASGPAAPPAPDLVHRRFHASRPDELWLADITHVPTWEGWLFLSVVMDVCTRRIVGWSMREDLKAELVVDALAMAVTRRRPNGQVIHHSDRGSQYASLLFGRTLRESRLLASMGSKGDPFDNAMCESVVSTLKEELLKRRSWRTREQARLAVFTYIETFYNPRRRHSSLGYLSPDEYEKMIKKNKSHDLQIATTC